MHLAMAIDTKRCIGCHTCACACKLENNLPHGIWWNQVKTVGGEALDTPEGTYPNTKMSYLTVACQHCENPACTKVCPVGATYKDPETGIVRQDYDKCIGCRMCISACPYTGVRSFNWEEPRAYFAEVVGDVDSPVHQKHTVEKCTFCAHRSDRGDYSTACVDACLAQARWFGDLDDPGSEISQIVATRAYETLLEEHGTRPSVYFLV